MSFDMFQPPLIQLLHLRWSAGSVLFLASWAVLMGPIQYAQHLTSGSRLPFTAAYFGTIALTMYFAVGVSSISLFHDRNISLLTTWGRSKQFKLDPVQPHLARHVFEWVLQSQTGAKAYPSAPIPSRDRTPPSRQNSN